MDVRVQGDDPRPLREHDPLTRLTSPGLELRRKGARAAKYGVRHGFPHYSLDLLDAIAELPDPVKPAARATDRPVALVHAHRSRLRALELFARRDPWDEFSLVSLRCGVPRKDIGFPWLAQCRSDPDRSAEHAEIFGFAIAAFEGADQPAISNRPRS
jgi:hypothetical protein